MAIKRVRIKVGQKPTAEQWARIRELEAPYADLSDDIVYDDESPYYTYEQLLAMKEAADRRREERRRQPVSIRLLPETIKKAKALGRGYTGILARIIETALDDPEFISRCL